MTENFFKQSVLLVLIILLPLGSFKNKENQRIKNVQFSVVAEIGVEEAKTKEEEAYQFYYIRTIDCDKDGNLYVLDHKEVCIKIFDKNGKFIRKILREGQGPDEIINPIRLGINRFTGSIFVLQEYGFQMKEFDVWGRFIKLYNLPEQFFQYFEFIDKNRFVYIASGKYGEKIYSNFKIFNLNLSKIEKEFVPIQRVSLSSAYQRFIIKDDILWTCPGDKMDMVGYDMKTGKEVITMPIDESYKEYKILRGPNWQAIRLYNFAQPLVINGNIYILVTKQDFVEVPRDSLTVLKIREIKLYRLEKNHLNKISELPDFGFFVDFHATWQNRIIISSSGYDLYPQIKILEISE